MLKTKFLNITGTGLLLARCCFCHPTSNAKTLQETNINHFVIDKWTTKCCSLYNGSLMPDNAKHAVLPVDTNSTAVSVNYLVFVHIKPQLSHVNLLMIWRAAGE